MDDQIVVVLITAPSKEVAHQIAMTLVEQKLAACVNIIPAISSVYSWDGKIQVDEEVLLLCKSRIELFNDRLVPTVQRVHPYEVPEIIALPVMSGSKNYLEWVFNSTSPGVN